MQLSLKTRQSRHSKYDLPDFEDLFRKSSSNSPSRNSDVQSQTSQKDQRKASPENGKHLPLSDLIVYVEIFSNKTNISEASFGYLETLGAKLEKRMNKKCNLVIWKDGSIKTVERAKEYGVPVVNSRWLEECMENHECADFSKFAPILPNKDELLFKNNQDKKKRKAQEPLNPNEDLNFEGVANSSKSMLKRVKTNAFDGEFRNSEEKTTLRFSNQDEKPGARVLRKSQTAKPTFGRGVFDMEEEDETNKISEDRDMVEEKPEDPKIIELKKKKEAEEHRNKVKSLISKYTKSSSLIEEEKVESPRKSESEKRDESEERNSWRAMISYNEKDTQSEASEQEHISPVATPKTYGLATRLMIREEEEAIKERKKKEAEEQAGNPVSYGDSTLDISAATRIQLLKIERVNKEQVSMLWMKYAGKKDVKPEEKKEEEKKESQIEVEKPEKKDMEIEEEEEDIQVMKVNRPKRQTRKTIEEESPEKKKSVSPIGKGKKIQEKESVEKNTPIGKSLKAETRIQNSAKSTAAKSDKTSEKLSLGKSTNGKSSVASSYWDLDETPNPRRGRSRGKLEEEEEKDEKKQASPSPVKKEEKRKGKQEQEQEKKGVSQREARNNQKIQEEKSLAKKKARRSSSSEDASEDEEEEEEKPKVEKKVTNTKTQKEKKETKVKEEVPVKAKAKASVKSEKLVLLDGFSEGGVEKAKQFCTKFGFKLLESDNLSQLEFLIFEGDSMSRNEKKACAMANGKSILKKSWLEESLKKGKLQTQKQYEEEYDKASRQKLFKDMRFYVSKETEEPLQREDFVQIIENCGGKVMENVRVCDFCIVEKGAKVTVEIPPHVKTIFPQWVIDSVLEGKCVNTNKGSYAFV